jgi:hypothetical protein
MNNFLKQIFKDIDGQYSSKRTTVFISILILISTWVGNFFYQMQISEFIFEGFLYITVVGLGVTVAEKFSRKGESVSVSNVLETENIIEPKNDLIK